MRSTLVFVSYLAAASAFPGMRGLVERLSNAEEDVNTKIFPGDLEGQDEAKLSPTGKAIRDILQGNGNPEDLTTAYHSVPNMNSAACRADKCCIWKHIADEMKSMMLGDAGRCNNLARQCVRMGFHDSSTWSLNTGKGGGADGSLVLARECYDRPINNGLQSGCNQMQIWYNKYKYYGISMADLIQMGGKLQHIASTIETHTNGVHNSKLHLLTSILSQRRDCCLSSWASSAQLYRTTR